MVFGPTTRVIAPEALPEATVLPLTVIAALACAAVGVTVRLAVALRTVAV